MTAGGALDVPGRVRRPADVALLALAVVGLVTTVALATGAATTTDALEHDLSLAVEGLPRVLLSAISFAGGVGAVLLTAVLALDLVRRGRLPLFVEAVAAAGLGAAATVGVEWLLARHHLPPDVVNALTRPLAGGGRTSPASEVVVATTALLSAAAGSHRIQRPGVGVVAALALTAFLGGDATGVALAVSALLGLVVGFGIRVLVGRPSTGAGASRVAEALAAAGVATGALAPGPARGDGVRRYSTGRPEVRVEVFDRDAVGSGFLSRILRMLAVRTGGARAPALTLRGQVEHAALMGLALDDATVAAPRLLRAVEVDGDSVATAWELPGGTPVAQSPRLDEDTVAALWRLLAALQDRGIAHRGIAPSTLLVGPGGQAALAEVGRGDIAAPELALRLDVANLLAVTALHADADVAVRHAIAALGADRVTGALPVLQPIALERSLRARLRRRPELLGAVQDAVLALGGGGEPSPEVELRRVTPRAVVTVVGGGVAGYLLAGQLSRVDLGRTVLDLDRAWAGTTVLFSALTFLAASLTLRGAAPVRLSYPRAVLTQLAVAFAGLVAPAMLGNVALNTRLLRRAGASPGAAAGALGLVSVTQFGSYTALLAAASVAAGIGPRASFTPPPGTVIGLLGAVLAVVLALMVPRVRDWARRRFLPQLSEILPAVMGVLRRPARVAQLLGGALLLDASFVAALYCATRAAGVDPPLAGVAVVYFAGAIIGSAVPTPGGLGGVEAAMTAGLVAIGAGAGPALSAVLLYRLATYWLPIPLGWAALHELQRVKAL